MLLELRTTSPPFERFFVQSTLIIILSTMFSKVLLTTKPHGTSGGHVIVNNYNFKSYKSFFHVYDGGFFLFSYNL